MSARPFAWPALALALLLMAAPASAVTLTVVWSNEAEVGYNALLIVEEDGGGDATFSSCDYGGCPFGWDLEVTFSEQPNPGDGPFVYSGSITHGAGQTFVFDGVYNLGGDTPANAAVLPNVGGDDHYGLSLGYNEVFQYGFQYNFVLNAAFVESETVVPEPAAVLLVGVGLVGLRLRTLHRK